MERSKLIPLIALLGALLLVVGWWLARAGDESSSSASTLGRERPREREQPGPVSVRQANEREPKSSASSPRASKAEFDRAKRDALRTQILQALADRPPQPASAAGPREDDPRAPGQLTDRIGGREALLEHLNHDFMPLADECIEQARTRRPELAGMLAIGLDTVADEELGGIVESVAMQPENEVDDPELIECMSQTALSMILPPPPESGREQFMITIPIEPE